MPNQFTASLWGDEGFSAILSMKPIPEIIRVIIRDTSPPLYNITEHLAFQMFGTSEVVIRGLSFFYYLLTILFVFLIVSHIWSRKTALFAAVLTFFNPFFFIYAFEGRMYSIMALGVAASMYFFITKKWFWYALATAWALYSHHFAIFAVFVQGLWFLKEVITRNTVTAKKMFKAFLFVGILYSPWLIPLYRQTRMVSGGFWLGTPTLDDLRNLTYEYLAQGIKHSLAEPALYLTFVLLIIRDWTKRIEKSLFLLLWFAVPILLTWFVSQQFQSIFFNRYLLYTIPAGMIILSTNKRVPASNIVLGVLIGMFIIIDFNYFTHPVKRPFRELATYVKETKKEEDFLINWNSGAHHLWETKYYGIPAPIYIPSGGELPFFVGTALMEEGDIVQELPENERVGVVTSGNPDEVELPQNYEQSDRKAFGDLTFTWYRKVQEDGED